MSDEQKFIPPYLVDRLNADPAYCGTGDLARTLTHAQRVQIEGHRALWLNSPKLRSLRQLQKLTDRGTILRGVPGGLYYTLQRESALGPILRSYRCEPRLLRRDRLRLIGLDAVDQKTVDWMLNLPPVVNQTRNR